MNKVITVVLLLSALWLNAQNTALFERATTAYNEGDYNEAITNYLKILDNGEHSASLYFNLGNSYYKLNQIAPSIYYYEKALILKPNDREVENNLTYARNMTLDAFETLPETGLSRIYSSTAGWLSFDQWAYVAVVFMLLFVLFYIAFYYFRYSRQKRIAFISSMISIFLVVISVIFAIIQFQEFNAEQPAIVFSEESSIRSEPNKRSSETFVLHEGTKVNVLEELNSYKKIQLVDGKTGWIPEEDIKLLKDF